MQDPVTKRIIQKIRSELALPIESERQVVYVLAQIRKLLDIRCGNEKSQPFQALRFYCNWSLHVELDRGLTEVIVKNLDRQFAEGLSGDALTERSIELLDKLGLTRFRSNLKEFFEEYGLPSQICTDDEMWLKFTNWYLSVIEDCPLILKSENRNLKHINKVVLETKMVQFNDGRRVSFSVWTLYCDKERRSSIQIDFKAMAEYGFALQFIE